MDEAKGAADDLVEAVTERAVEILSLPLEEREDRYHELREVHLTAALATGVAAPMAGALSANLEQWIRKAVRVIGASAVAGGETA